jgi:hypothetical protein
MMIKRGHHRGRSRGSIRPFTDTRQATTAICQKCGHLITKFEVAGGERLECTPECKNNLKKNL